MKTFRILSRIFLAVFIVYAAICVLIWLNQESLLFIPESLPKRSVYKFDAPFTEIDVPLEKNVSLNALYFASSPSKGLVFFLHGNAGNAGDTRLIADQFLTEGYDFCVMDFRGFGKSGGTIESEKQFYKDAFTVFDKVISQKRPQNVIVCGYSIGTATAAKIASQRKVDKLVLMAPYYSMSEVARAHYPFVPPFILRYPFETANFVKKVKCPLILFHGRNDGTIRCDASVRLAKLAQPHSTVVLIPDCGHNDIARQERFKAELHDFLDRSPIQISHSSKFTRTDQKMASNPDDHLLASSFRNR
jgi:uncharacterized protein